jgi:hypothetical protein
MIGIAPVWNLVLIHGWPGTDGQGCDIPCCGKGMTLEDVLPNCFIWELEL